MPDLEVRPECVDRCWRKLFGDQYDGLAHVVYTLF
jgi:hypothetical protein